MSEATPEPVWVSVLLDWQNIYGCAREAFGLDSGSIPGTVDPLKLARRLVAGVDPTTGGVRQLQEIRIYRGRPSNKEDPKGYSAWRSQTDAWAKSCGSVLVPRYRDLRYRGGHPVEKGIDVALAVDLVRLAMNTVEPDRVIVVSSDTDMIPALEVAVEMRGQPFLEVAGWVGHKPSAALVGVEGARQHKMDRVFYEQVHDPDDYNIPIRIRRPDRRRGEKAA